MATTYTAIASQILSTTAASVTFSSIPGTYTDLVLKVSSRTNGATTSQSVTINFNGSVTGYSLTWIVADGGTTPASARYSSIGQSYPFYSDSASATTNTFGSADIYIPNYTAAINKAISSISATENNATGSGTAYLHATGSLWQNTAAITSIVLAPGAGSFISGSRFDLYGITHI